MFAAEALTDLYSKRLAAVDIDYVQRSELLAVTQLMVHEVETLGAIGALGSIARLAIYCRLAAARSIAKQHQPLFAIEAINQIASHRPALAPQQNMLPPITVTDPRLRDFHAGSAGSPSVDRARSACAGWSAAGVRLITSCAKRKSKLRSTYPTRWKRTRCYRLAIRPTSLARCVADRELGRADKEPTSGSRT
jgi:hypothetical protein